MLLARVRQVDGRIPAGSERPEWRVMYARKMLDAIREAEQAQGHLNRIAKQTRDQMAKEHQDYSRVHPRYAARAQGQELGWRVMDKLKRDLDFQDQLDRRTVNTQAAIMYGVAALLLESNDVALTRLTNILGGEAA